MSTVFIAFQANEETRPIIEAILEDNPAAEVEEQPDLVGRRFDLQEMHINLITLSGHVDEDDDQFTLSWNS